LRNRSGLQLLWEFPRGSSVRDKELKSLSGLEWTPRGKLVGPGLMEWQRHCNKTRIDAISAELERLWLSHSSINKARGPILARLVMGPANPILHK